MFELEKVQNEGATIKVVGVGGGGCNAINTMIRDGLEGVDFITVNTDKQALEASLAPTKLAVGQELTKGLGAGADPEVGRQAALEDYAKISEMFSGADMVFLTGGMGGGTGTGALPVFAKIAKEIGALTVGVVTKPFMFEGKKRSKNALGGISRLRENVDSLITIPNQRLLMVAGANLSMIDAFKRADDVLLNAVQGISDLINHTGLINSDFADVKTIMQNKGLALMGIGYAEGEHRAVEAATNAVSSPLLEDVKIEGATGIIINITGGSTLKIHEVNEATSLIMEAAHEDAEIIFGTVIDESLKEKIKVTVIATGIHEGDGEMTQTQSRESQSVAANVSQTLGQELVPNIVMPPEPTEAMLGGEGDVAADINLAQAEMATIEPPVQTAPTAEPPAPPAQAKDLVSTAAAAAAAAKAKAEALQREIKAKEEAKAAAPAQQSRPGLSASSAEATSELAIAKKVAQRLGITNLADDDYDIPTYLRKHEDRGQHP